MPTAIIKITIPTISDWDLTDKLKGAEMDLTELACRLENKYPGVKIEIKQE